MTIDTTTQSGELFNETLIQSYISRDQNPRFLARPWLTERVEAALKEDDCRFVLLTAEPGAGKTAFMAWLADQHPGWPRYFIRRDQRTPLQDADDHSFLLRIGYQLAATRPELFSREQVQLVVEQRLGDVADGGEAVGAKISRLLASPFYQKVIDIRQYVERTGGAVTGLKIDELVIESRLLSPEDLQNMALFDPARALQTTDPEARIVILVDALDEIRYHGVAGSLLEWLTHCPEVPDNVRFVLTSRRPDGPTRLFCEKQKPFMQQLTIEAGDEPVQRELEVYARALAQEPDVASILEGIETGADEFIEEAVAKADGNIGYLDALARGVDQARDSKDQEGLQKLLTRQELPRYIEGLYAFFMRQIKESIGEQQVRVRDSGTGKSHFPLIWDEVYWPVLGVLCVAREPLLPDAIHRLGAIEAEEQCVTAALDRLGQFLDRPDGRCRLYHATLPEFLTAETTQQDPETQDLAISPATWHRRIADYYWEKDHPNWQKLQDAPDGAYGLNNLAPHLSGSQDERLRALINQEWMAARFEGSDYTYDGFIADVMLAWQAAHEEALGQSEADQVPAALADCIRSALIRTSINSLSASYVPALVARAVEIGLWSAERALSVASRVPDPEQRSHLYMSLLASGRLGPDDSARARKAGMAAAQAIDGWGGNLHRVRALMSLAAHSSGYDRTQVLEAALAAAMAIDDRYTRWEALLDLRAELSGEALVRALDEVSSLEQWWRSSEAWTKRHKTLNGVWRQGEALAARTKAEEPSQAWRGISLTQLWKAETLESAMAIKGEWSRAKVLAALAPQLSGAERTQAVDAGLKSALAIEDDKQRVEALAALAPYLSGDALEQGLAATLTIEGGWQQAKALANLIPPRGVQTALVAWRSRARKAVLAIEHAWARAGTPAPQRRLSKTLSIEDDYRRARALAALAPQLSGEARIEALERGLDATLAIGPEMYRAQVLLALAPQLTGEALARGLEAALAIGNEGDRAQALAALAPRLTGEARRRALETALDGALTIRSKRYCVETLAALAGHLAGEARTRALNRGLDAALAIGDEWNQAHALAALAPQLIGEAADRGLEAALAIRRDGPRARALAALAAHLTGEAQARALKRGLEAVLAINLYDDQARTLEAFLAMTTDPVVLRAMRQAIADHLLKNLSVAKREDLLWFCSNGKLFSPPLLDQSTLVAMGGHIVEVCQEWRWM